MIARIESLLHRFRRRLSRSEALIRLLRLPVSTEAPTARGLILVQIDGLSEQQVRRALDAGRLPFLRRLMAHDRYRLRPFYSGLPSSTPAVQGELFYGVRTAVPAFGFIDLDSGHAARMSDPATARRIEERLEREGREPLLAGGSAYGDIFTGGAAESHVCASALGWGPVLSRMHPVKTGLIALAHLPGLLRAAGLLVAEAVLALRDAVTGAASGHGLGAEMRFVPMRLGASVLLREMAIAGASLDAARGLPVIHLNLLGYDEQAHRRGPSSAFAHWTLKGIDAAIARLWDECRATHRRDYDLWIYADHGQADAVPFALRPALENTLGGCEMAVLGRIGAVRLHDRTADRLAAAEAAVAAGVPLALARDEQGVVQAVTADGRHPLPQEAGAVLGDDHPFLHQAAQDLEALGRHPSAGDLLVIGWRHGGPSLSFTSEYGAHGGPAPEEVGAFALLPPGAPVPPEDDMVLRPEDLRRAAFTWLATGAMMAPSRPDRLRVMTYNVHSCLGMDGRTLPERIARVIATLHPDVVCLQEVDVERRRSGGIDQAHAIAKALEMEFHFHPSLRIEEEQYGTAILSRLPMRVLRAGPLPSPHGEQRGAIKVEVMTPRGPAVVVATHLGVLPRERRPQAASLVRDGWLEVPPGMPLVVCGDFNAMPRSMVHRLLCAHLTDAQRTGDRKPQATWPARLPSARIDHVFVGPGVHVRKVEVGRGALARIASDHLPLVVDVSW
ncbi:endonuclease/exonuclease/phosphatase family protein [Novispirillum sp. DQ9]|uniref:endonuclease/exonuclease/phosphatase family protein n=1 Tax=Novispirillum sp. DQ9 TaxID=3398612 RepID=UPI003C7DF691